MGQKQAFKEMLHYNKSVLVTSFNAVSIFQDQLERNMRMFLDQAAWLPAEGRKVVEEWVKASRQGRENFKKAVDEGFRKLETIFGNVKTG